MVESVVRLALTARRHGSQGQALGSRSFARVLKAQLNLWPRPMRLWREDLESRLQRLF